MEIKLKTVMVLPYVKGSTKYFEKNWEIGYFIQTPTRVGFIGTKRRIVIVPESIIAIKPFFEEKEPPANYVSTNFKFHHKDVVYEVLVAFHRERYGELMSAMWINILGTPPIFLKYPYKIGGVLNKEVAVRKGILFPRPDRIIIKLRDQTLLSIPLDSLLDVKKEPKEIRGVEKPALELSYLEDDEEISMVIFTYPVILSRLEEFCAFHLSKLLQEFHLGEIENTLLTTLYAGGVPYESLQIMLGLTHEELDKLYDKLISYDMIKVVRIRRDVALTKKGMTYVDKLMRSGKI